MTSFKYFPDGGFMAAGGVPDVTRPQDWIVWHFTHIENLPAIVESGCLRAASAVDPRTSVALNSVKQRRASRAVTVQDPSYPHAFVGDHVPFYFAAKSPMLFRVCKGHEDYSGGAEPIVFLGFQVGDLVSACPTWCASNENAATNLAQFTTQLSGLGRFIDFDLMRQRDWYNTTDDANRKSRRAAEFLVYGTVPLASVVCVYTQGQSTLDAARSHLSHLGNRVTYTTLPKLFYS